MSEFLASNINETISAKFVGLPSRNAILNDILIALKNFRSKLRWKYHRKFFKGDDDQDGGEEELEEETERIQDLGLKTGLYDKLQIKNCPYLGDEATEKFIKDVTRKLIENVPTEEPSKLLNLTKNQKLVDKFMKTIKTEHNFVFPRSDKTDKFIRMEKDKYDKIMKHNLSKNCVQVQRQEILELVDDALKKVDEFDCFSKSERNYMQKTILRKSIPNPKLLCKDHKSTMCTYPDGVVSYHTRLIIPCNSFLACFQNIGYRSIKAKFDKYNINFERTIKNSDEMINKLRNLGINQNEHSIISWDIKSMYPNILIEYCEQALEFFMQSWELEVDKEEVRRGFKICKYGMEHILLRYGNDYYEYRGENDKKSLCIGGYESAWFADLVVAWLFTKIEENLERDTVLAVIYRDDGCICFNGRWRRWKIEKWNQEMMKKIQEFAPTIEFEFDVMEQEMPFLDLLLSWEQDGELFWSCYKKPESQKKYLNHDSLHTRSCKQNIGPECVRRLAKLTKKSEDLENVKISDFYPDHYEAILKAGLKFEGSNNKFLRLDSSSPADEITKNRVLNPIFKESWAQSECATKSTRFDKRPIKFITAFSGGFLRKPVYKILKQCRDNNELWWLRIKVIYSRFTNLEEMVQADLMSKIDSGIESIDLMNRPCNCSSTNKDDNDVCIYEGDCRKKVVIYGANCLICKSIYIGSTQGTVKDRMGGHAQDVRDYFRKGKKADSFQSHFSKHIENGDLERLLGFDPGSIPSQANIRKMYRTKVLWRSKSNLAASRKFGTDKCKLCSEERLQILRWKSHEQRGEGILPGNPVTKVINRNADYFATCLHKPKIHSLTR